MKNENLKSPATYDVGTFTDDKTLRLGRNEGPLSLPCQAANGLSADALNRYPSYSELQMAYAQWIGVDPARVVVTAGGDEGIDRMIRLAIIGERNQVVVHAPSFEMVDIYTRQSGGDLHKVTWFDGPFPLTEYLQQLNERTALAVVVSPNNPTGQVIEVETLEKISEETNRLGIPLLVDLAYVEFADQDPTPHLLTLPNVTLVRTLSKAWGLAGLRVGFLVASDAEAAGQLRRFGGPFTIGHVSVELALRALQNQAKTMVAQVSEMCCRRKELDETIARCGGITLPSQGNFLLAQFPRQPEIARELESEGIVVRKFHDSALLDGWVRITCPASSGDYVRLVRALAKVTHSQLAAPTASLSQEDPKMSKEMNAQFSTGPRSARRVRSTNETTIQCQIDLDGTGQSSVDTGIGFLDHMLTALARHSGMNFELTCSGDLEVDDHHTSEDCAIVIGETILEALGDRRGVRRFGSAYCPLDEALARAVIDLSGRPWPEIHLGLVREHVGTWATENITHFFQSLALNLKCSLHLDIIRGANDHHRAEAAFKALALAIKEAIAIVGSEIPSTKGVLA